MSDGITEARRGTYFKNRSINKNHLSMNELREKIFEQIEKERDYQDEKWGTEFDKLNTINDWNTYINIYMGRACEMRRSKKEQRELVIKVATLAVAALERFDENDGFFPRHYDDEDGSTEGIQSD